MSLNVPVAENCCVSPFGIDGLEGDRARETRVGVDTLSVADPLTEPVDAVIVAMPGCLLTAIPGALMVATAGCETLQLAV